MISIILLSSLVSLITLGILFIQRVSPERIKIPSFFLGVRHERPLSHVKTKPPFWWEIVAVLLFTLGAGLAYNAQTQNAPSEKGQGEGMIWFDSTISHLGALRSSRSAREYVIDSLKDLRFSKYLFIELSYNPDSNGIPQASYTLQSIAPAEIEKYVMEKLGTPSVLSQPLQSNVLLQSLQKITTQNLQQSTLTLVTDAQSETLRPVASLNGAFESIRVIKTPTSTDAATTVQKTSLVPEELAQIWNAANPNDASNSLPSTPQLVRLDAQLSARIPRQARPSLTLEEFELKESDDTAAKPLAFITSQDPSSTDTNQTLRGNPPLITTCTFSVAGPSELDGLSDLRAYAQFFSIPMRPLACKSTESSVSARAADGLDPWKYRRSSIWVVPVNETVAGELFQQGLYWTPEGYAPETDALVYIADTRLAGLEGLMESVNVQLEENQPTIRLPLLPLPPSPLTFPWQIRSPSNALPAKPIGTQDTTAATLLLKASDGTPMAFALSENPVVVYLRTGGAATNGELGRWGKWAGLWSSLAQRLKNSSPTLTNIRLNTPQDWSQWFVEQKKLQLPKLRYVIDGQSLNAQLIQNQTALLPIPALYIRERDDQMVLVEPPLSEKLSEIMTNVEIEQLFPARSLVVQRTARQHAQASGFQWLGAILAGLSLVLLWIVQQKKQRALLDARASLRLLAGVCLFSGFLTSHPAAAQSLRSVPKDSRVLRATENKPQITSHPFRVGWCDANIPEAVQQRYKYLQNLLASRGTIELPRQLNAGACRLGAAEIWWTSSLEALQAAPVAQHIRSGGVVIAEGIQLTQTPEWMLSSADQSIGLVWESPKRRGLLYRSFYLLSSFDGCTPERTLILTLRKKVNAQAPMGLVTPVRFLTSTSEGADCFLGDDDSRSRSFVNLMYGLLTTDYKEDQMQLPEILNRVRNLGLEP